MADLRSAPGAARRGRAAGQRRHHGRHPSFKNAATIGYVVRAAQAGLVQYFPDLRPVLVNADAGSPDGTQRVVVETEPPDYVERILLVRPRNKLQRISLTYPEIDGVGGKGAALRTIFQIADALSVQALVVVDSDLRSIVPEWIELLAGPILKGGFDFVAPLYSRYKYDGTITNTVTYPLTRALYGLRIRQPIGGDFGVVGDLVRALPGAGRLGRRRLQVRHRHLDDDERDHRRLRGLPDAPGRQGPRPQGSGRRPGPDVQPGGEHAPAPDRRARRPLARGPARSHDIPVYGFERIIDPPPLDVNVARLLEEFARGRLTVGDVWRRRSRPRPADVGRWRPRPRGGRGCRPGRQADAAEDSGFNFPDEVWARVIYDMASPITGGCVPMRRARGGAGPALLRPGRQR